MRTDQSGFALPRAIVLRTNSTYTPMTRSGRNTLGEGALLSWDSKSKDAEFLDKIVSEGLILESATPKSVWLEHAVFQKYKLESFRSALNKAKNKYQVHLKDQHEKETGHELLGGGETAPSMDGKVRNPNDGDLKPAPSLFGSSKGQGKCQCTLFV